MTATQMKILIVEDSERRVQLFQSWTPPDVRFVWARSAGAAIGLLSKSSARSYDGIMLDHDLTQQPGALGGERYNGLHVAREVVRRIDSDVPVLVHSGNATGSSEMVRALKGGGFDVGHVPMPDMTPPRYLTWLESVRAARAQYDEDNAES